MRERPVDSVDVSGKRWFCSVRIPFWCLTIMLLVDKEIKLFFKLMNIRFLSRDSTY